MVKFQWGHPNGGAKYTRGKKIYDCRQITRHVSKMVQERHIVSIRGELKVVRALSKDDIAGDLE